MKEAQTIFRDVINRPHIHAKLRRNDADFTAICAAMDVIGDADSAFVEFLERVNRGGSLGYLDLYGVYQAIQVTVDALRAFVSTLKVSLPNRRAIEALSEERNWVAGHLVYRKENGVKYSSFIHRSMMSPANLVVTHSGLKNGSSRTTTYSPIEAVSRMRELRDRALIEMAKNVVAIDREERLAKVSDSLASCFHSSADWMLDHVAVAPYSDSERLGVFDNSVDTLCKQIETFVERAKRLDLGDVFPEVIRDAGTTIKMLERVLVLAHQSETEPSIDLIAFSESAVVRTRELVKLAQEIDKSLAEEVREIA